MTENNNIITLDDMKQYRNIVRFVNESDEEVKVLFNEVNSMFIDIVKSFDDEVEKSLFVSKYHNTYIKLLTLDIRRNDSNINEDIKILLRNFLFCLEQENITKVYNIEFEEQSELKVSGR